MKIAIVGMGLIGGSLARVIKKRTDHTVYAWNRSKNVLKEAAEIGAMDAELTDENLPECDMIIVGLYPELTIGWLREKASIIAKDAVVLDCCGVKQLVCEELMPLAEEYGWHFVGGHPMAGREFSGFQYTTDDLFDRASMILVPKPDEDQALIERLRRFFLEELRFRCVQLSTPEQHDEIIAYTSQLAHIVSSAYVKGPAALHYSGFAAGSFADMTRVARLNADMWTELFFENRSALLLQVDGLIERLTMYRDALRDGERAAMHDLLQEGNEIKISLEKH